jgi:hypothetical protein
VGASSSAAVRGCRRSYRAPYGFFVEAAGAVRRFVGAVEAARVFVGAAGAVRRFVRAVEAARVL